MLGFRYRLHRKDLPGAPDLVFPGRKKVIFVHGCFWHAHKGCKVANQPKSRSSFWTNKFEGNVRRDRLNQRRLRRSGWDICTIWECETKDEAKLALRIQKFLSDATELSTRKS